MFVNKIVAYSLIFFMLCSVIYLFTLVKFIVVGYLNRFPPMKCKQELDKNIHKEFAIFDKQAALNDTGIGLYHCYCQKHSSKWEALNRDFYDSEKNVCLEYTYQTLIGQISSLGVAAAISIINKLIEYIAHFFIKRIGFSYVTEELTSLMTTIFYS